MKIEFLGLKKTKKKFISDISNKSKDIDSLISKLNRLDIFSSINIKKNKIDITEQRNRINLSSNTTSGNPKNSLNIIFPNIFGSGENFRLTLSSLVEYELRFTKPFLFKDIYFFNYIHSMNLLKLPSEDFEINKHEAEIGIGNVNVGIGLERLYDQYQNYIKFIYKGKQNKIGTSKINIFSDLMIKIGCFNSRFTKIEYSNTVVVDLIKNFKHSVNWGIGSIFGTPPKYERFFLGKNIKGYNNNSISPIDYNQSTGGLSYFEITNKLILKNFYVFNSLGYNSRQRNLVETLRSTFKEIRNKNSSCLGISVGAGVSIPLSKSVNSPTLDGFISFPLTNNRNIEKYQLGFNLDF